MCQQEEADLATANAVADDAQDAYDEADVDFQIADAAYEERQMNNNP